MQYPPVKSEEEEDLHVSQACFARFCTLVTVKCLPDEFLWRLVAVEAIFVGAPSMSEFGICWCVNGGTYSLIEYFPRAVRHSLPWGIRNLK